MGIFSLRAAPSAAAQLSGQQRMQLGHQKLQCPPWAQGKFQVPVVTGENPLAAQTNIPLPLSPL